MERCLTYLPPIHAKAASTIQEEKWDEALQLFNTNQFDKVIPTLIDYIDPSLSQYKTADGYSIPHGSVIVNITQNQDTIHIQCPFVDIKNAKRLPLMRKLAELRQHPLVLTTVKLNDDKAVFDFSCPMNLCEPHKLYNVLREICVFADEYDDEFIEKFDAVRLFEPKIEPVSTQMKEEAHRKFQQILTEGLDMFNYYTSKRNTRNAFYAVNCTFKRLEFYAQPQGFLKTEIERAIDDFFDRSIHLHERMLKGKAKLEYFLNFDKEKFANSLYKIQTFVPSKYNGKIENIRDNWETPYDEIKNMMNSSDFEDASIYMLSCIYDYYYYSNPNKEISENLFNALTQASGLSWAEAAPILFKGMQQVMEDDMTPEMDFGMDLSKVMGEQMAMMQKMFGGMMNQQPVSK